MFLKWIERKERKNQLLQLFRNIEAGKRNNNIVYLYGSYGGQNGLLALLGTELKRPSNARLLKDLGRGDFWQKVKDRLKIVRQTRRRENQRWRKKNIENTDDRLKRILVEQQAKMSSKKSLPNQKQKSRRKLVYV